MFIAALFAVQQNCPPRRSLLIIQLSVNLVSVFIPETPNTLLVSVSFCTVCADWIGKRVVDNWPHSGIKPKLTQQSLRSLCFPLKFLCHHIGGISVSLPVYSLYTFLFSCCCSFFFISVSCCCLSGKLTTVILLCVWVLLPFLLFAVVVVVVGEGKKSF